MFLVPRDDASFLFKVVERRQPVGENRPTTNLHDLNPDSNLHSAQRVVYIQTEDILLVGFCLGLDKILPPSSPMRVLFALGHLVQFVLIPEQIPPINACACFCLYTTK